MSASAAQALGETGRAGRLKALSPVLAAWLMALFVMALSFVPMTAWTIRNGVLFDNDDAMRLVQVREFMDGKGWYDLNETRVDPPHGMVSHWPRLIELPIAGGIAIAERFADRDLAERIVVGVWPSVMLAAFVLGLLLVASRLFAPPTLFAAAAIVAFSPLLQFQLAPGRIDHHGVQMLLALALAAATIGAIVGGRRSAAVAAGVVGALIVAIGLETLPIVAGAAVLFGAAWIFQGESLARSCPRVRRIVCARYTSPLRRNDCAIALERDGVRRALAAVAVACLGRRPRASRPCRDQAARPDPHTARSRHSPQVGLS